MMKGRKKRKGMTGADGRLVSRKMQLFYLLLRFSVILVMIAQFFNRNYQNAALCVLTLALFWLPNMIERRLGIDVPDTLEVIILLFIYAAEILGEIREFYIAIPYWDTILHTLNGFLAAAIGFSMVDILNREERVALKLSPFFMAVTVFCFSMSIGVLWEFFEHFMDVFFKLDMQKDTILHTISTVNLDPNGGNKTVVLRQIVDTMVVYADGSAQALGLGGYLDIGLYDTMKDLFVNFIGAAVFSVLGYFYVKTRGKHRFLRRFIPTVVETKEAEREEK